MDNTRPTNLPPDQHQTPVQNQQSSNSMVGNTKEISTPFIAPRANDLVSKAHTIWNIKGILSFPVLMLRVIFALFQYSESKLSQF